MTAAHIKVDRLEENSHLLKPPVNNYCVYNEDFTIMVRLFPSVAYSAPCRECA
jgi:hypothetical protein